MLWILIFTSLLFKVCISQITGYGNTTADYSGAVHYRCAVTNPRGVRQVTWQRLFKDDSIENLATYSTRFGQQVNDPYKEKVIFTEASLGSSSITLRNVTWDDESCYICSFNVYPDGSKRTQICLTVRGISEVKTEVQAPSDVAVVFSCSATGKPAPTIQWEFSPDATLTDQTQTATVTNSDHTFTSSSNITLRVHPEWKGHADCLLNSGVAGQRRERIPFSLPVGEKNDKAFTMKKNLSQHNDLCQLLPGTGLSSSGIAVVIAVVFILLIVGGGAAAAMKRKRLKCTGRDENMI